MDDGALLVTVGSLCPLWSRIFSSSCYVHVSSILSISKRKKKQLVQKKTKERKRERKKDLKRINLLFNLMWPKLNSIMCWYWLWIWVFCFDPKSSISEAQELIRSIEFLLKKLYYYWVWSHLHMLDYCCSPSLQITVCWKDPSLPTITPWVRLLAQYKFWRQQY